MENQFHSANGKEEKEKELSHHDGNEDKLTNGVSQNAHRYPVGYGDREDEIANGGDGSGAEEPYFDDENLDENALDEDNISQS